MSEDEARAGGQVDVGMGESWIRRQDAELEAARGLFDPGPALADEPRAAQLEHARAVSRALEPHGQVERINKATGAPLPEDLLDGVRAGTGLDRRWPDLWLRRGDGLDLLVRCCARTEKNRARASASFWFMEPDSWRFLVELDERARRALPAIVVLAFDEEPLTAVELGLVGALEHGLGSGQPREHGGSERFAIAPSRRVGLEAFLRVHS